MSLLQDFVSVVKQKIQPVRKRELRAEVLQGGLDFKDYYHQLGIYVSGLVSNRNPDHTMNHCWRFVRRSDFWSNDKLVICSFNGSLYDHILSLVVLHFFPAFLGVKNVKFLKNCQP